MARCDKTPPRQLDLSEFARLSSRGGMSGSWVETTSIGTLRSEDLGQAGHVFRYDHYLYRTLGQHLANGGMGTVYELERRDDDTGAVEAVVGKVFHSNYLYQLRTDEVTRRDHHNNLAAMARIAAIEHPNILPTYVSAPISDNYLFVTPRMGMTLLEAIQKHNLTPRARTKLLVQALEGLSTLHAARPRPPRLHAPQHPRRRGRERRLPVRLRSRDVARRRRRPDLPHLLQGPDLRLARLVGRARDDRSGADGLERSTPRSTSTRSVARCTACSPTSCCTARPTTCGRC